MSTGTFTDYKSQIIISFTYLYLSQSLAPSPSAEYAGRGIGRMDGGIPLQKKLHQNTPMSVNQIQ